MKEFFQLTMNNGVQDGVVCFILLVLGTLLIAGLVIGNVAFVYTTSEILDDYHSDVSLSPVACGFRVLVLILCAYPLPFFLQFQTNSLYFVS